jgi:hypothetical protein
MKPQASYIAPIETGIRVPIRSETTSFGEKISLSAATAHFLKIKVKTQRLDDGKLRVIRL